MRKVILDLEGINGNAFYIIGAFRRAAKLQGWKKDEIEKVTAEAMSGDYNHVLVTIMRHTETEDED